jgi:hypothetical protein
VPPRTDLPAPLERVRNIINHAGGIFLLDAQGCVQEWNKAAGAVQRRAATCCRARSTSCHGA